MPGPKRSCSVKMLLGAVLFCCLVSASYGFPPRTTVSDDVNVTKLINRNNGDRYLLMFVLSDGTFRYERGYFKPMVNSDERIWTVMGRYRFRSPDGELFSYKYTTAEGGFKQEQVENNSENPLEVVNRIDPKALASLLG